MISHSELNPVVSRITIYPIKSLDGVSLQKAVITEGGCLLHDRQYAMTDNEGKFINGKKNPLVHGLRSSFDLANQTVSFRIHGQESYQIFHLRNEKIKIEVFLSDYFGIPVEFNRNDTGRFLDKPDLSGLTIISTESLTSVSSWFKNLRLDETRKRFRASIEIENVPAFWEDHLFAVPGKAIEFSIGDVKLFGMEPRARCVVPTRDSMTGEVTFAFPKSFAEQRAKYLPEFSTLNHFGHYYFLSVDTHIPESEVGKWIQVGDQLKIIGLGI